MGSKSFAVAQASHSNGISILLLSHGLHYNHWSSRDCDLVPSSDLVQDLLKLSVVGND